MDADQVQTFQAAMWTTMAEFSEQDEEQKACMIFESIPIDALRSFVDDFTMLKTQDRLMRHLPELERFSLSLVGKGVGPAILIESSNKTVVHDMSEELIFDTNRVNAAMKMFVDRMNVNAAKFSLDNHEEDESQPPAPIGYRVCAFSDACHALSSFWNCICELSATPPDQLSSTILSCPLVARTETTTDNNQEDSLQRFSSIAELLSRSLCLFRGDESFELAHCHPDYDRNLVYPADKPAHGHMPPLGWLRPMLRYDGKEKEAESLSDEDLAFSNYQRRAPVPAVWIQRAEVVEGDGMIDLNVDGVVVKASGVHTYAGNACRFAREGEDKLRQALEMEIAVAMDR